MTWVAIGAGRKPSCEQTESSILEGRCALVPTAPLSLPTATNCRARVQTFESAAKLVVHQRELKPECRGFSVNPVAAADHRREFVFAGATRDDFPRLIDA